MQVELLLAAGLVRISDIRYSDCVFSSSSGYYFVSV
jgi:hypothetical protein